MRSTERFSSYLLFRENEVLQLTNLSWQRHDIFAKILQHASCNFVKLDCTRTNFHCAFASESP